MILNCDIPRALGGTYLSCCILIPQIEALLETLIVAKLIRKYPTIYTEPVPAMHTKQRQPLLSAAKELVTSVLLLSVTNHKITPCRLYFAVHSIYSYL